MSQQLPQNFRKARRYQLNKSSEAILKSGHPWILRGNVSSAASVFREGDRLRLVSGKNEVIGYGIYSSRGPIAIRILQRGPEFSLETLRKTIADAFEKRKSLEDTTDAYRLLHGENDKIPGITVDKYAKTWVVQTYSKGLYGLARLAVRILFSIASENPSALPLRILLVSPQRMGEGESVKTRFLRGNCPLPIREAVRLKDLRFAAKIPGQKGSFFLDVRNLRSYLLENESLSRNKHCLHLFCHTGFTSLCMEQAGALSVTSIDGSEDVLEEFASQLTEDTLQGEFREKNRSVFLRNHELIRSDLFRDWNFLGDRKFGLVVLDPPNLAPNQAALPSAKKAYKSLISKSLERLQPGGVLVLLSCSGRISDSEFEKIGRETIRSRGWKYGSMVRLPPEADHPVLREFPEGKYFKVHLYLEMNPIARLEKEK
ncbi:class I SAM-dependent rRNA methyltransferase [Leptospira fluminis]|uniref:Class I SAM-dependent rRNA methyltransferase n=1 Tax=Leptospira fluminis TaxID=2484979 RepID=A0A4R9GQ70_9LEPT|nr:class I SAM-dependent methyltransferase [Leptospira fluminis]TGK19353.1 class I SAM-dependent rRNA methyltransferase [Leptospira fluminis]